VLFYGENTVNIEIKSQLISLFDASVTAVAGVSATHVNLKKILLADNDFQPDLVVSIGKAASGMCAGALAALEENGQANCPALLITKYQHTDQDMLDNINVKVIESAHPVPDQNSLDAGKTALKSITDMPNNSQLLLLVSGGTSSLSEVLPEKITLDQWQAMTDEMLSSGFSIGQINAKRKEISQIKDGKLLQAFNGKQVKVLAISDVEGDDISVIGSGTGDTHRYKGESNVHLIGTNQVARQAIADLAQAKGYPIVSNTESMYDDVHNVAQHIATTLLKGAKDNVKGIYIFGGEPTVILPNNPGDGGRNQSLALALAIHIQGVSNISILVAGTDGSDGPTDAAGGIVDGNTVKDIDRAKQMLIRADAGTYLRNCDSIFITGPTNTNVMDVIIAIID
jgi:hydroxypyruvate reductase